MYRLEYTADAIRAMRRIPEDIKKTIHIKMLHIADDPYGKHNNALKLQGREGYRLRLGGWRIFYDIDNKKIIVWVSDVKPRGGSYQ